MCPKQLDVVVKAHVREAKSAVDSMLGGDTRISTYAIVWALSAIAWALVDIARAIRERK